MDIAHMARDVNLSTVQRTTYIPKFKLSENIPTTLLKLCLNP